MTWSQLKIWAPRILRGVIWVALLVLLAQRAPLWWHNFQLEGQTVAPASFQGVLGDQTLAQESFQEPAVLVFWATWCGPCTLELDSYRSAVNDGLLPADRVFAVSLDRDQQQLERVTAQRDYPFQVVQDRSGELARRYQVEMTPTQIHVERGGKIRWVSSGASLSGIARAEALFAR